MKRLSSRARGQGPRRIPSLKAQRRMQPYVHSSYLERPHDELKHHFHFSLKVVGEEGEHDVVHAKQGDQQKGGLGQSPGDRGGAGSGHGCPYMWAQKTGTKSRMCEDGLWGLISPISTCFCSASAVPISSCPPSPRPSSPGQAHERERA